MRKLKSQHSQLRKKLLSDYSRQYAPEATQVLPWKLLGRLVEDCVVEDSEAFDVLMDIVRRRDTVALLNLPDIGTFTPSEPQKYSSASAYFADVSVVSFLKKYPFGKVASVDPLAAAKKRFDKAEKLCRITNRRLRFYRRFGFRLNRKRQGLHGILHAARLKIAKWLGPLDLNLIYDYTRHGPGGSVGVSGAETTLYFKYLYSPYTVSTRALPYAEAAILADPLWRRAVVNQCNTIGDTVPSVPDCREIVRNQLKVVDYNKVTFVPKTALTHRAIAVEPTMNVYLQLGVGDFMTDVLRLWGTDLRSQARNQRLARIGSTWCGHPADCPITLDLSMASDTLSTELVRELLPDDWYSFLSDLRSPSGRLEDEIIHWSKFSSMGNGFTFQLETMIFKALAEVVVKDLGLNLDFVSVYGDDIIVPRGSALRLIEVLTYCGFSINTEKSFFFGPFRESCGKDWFEGCDVRPFFLRREIKSDKDLVFVINSLGGLAGCNVHRGNQPFSGVDTSGSLSRAPKALTFAYSRLHNSVRTNLLGPRVEDMEGHIHAPWDIGQSSALVLWNRDVQAWSYPSIKSSAIRYSGRPGIIYLQMMTARSSSKLSFAMDDADSSVGYCLMPQGSRGNELPYVTETRDGKTKISPTIATGGGSKSYVVKRKQTKLRLATLTSNSWRND